MISVYAFVTNFNNWFVLCLFQQFFIFHFTKDFHKISVMHKSVSGNFFLPNPEHSRCNTNGVSPESVEGSSMGGLVPFHKYSHINSPSLLYAYIAINSVPPDKVFIKEENVSK